MCSGRKIVDGGESIKASPSGLTSRVWDSLLCRRSRWLAKILISPPTPGCPFSLEHLGTWWNLQQDGNVNELWQIDVYLHTFEYVYPIGYPCTNTCPPTSHLEFFILPFKDFARSTLVLVATVSLVVVALRETGS